jgi:hypothetical protein
MVASHIKANARIVSSPLRRIKPSTATVSIIALPGKLGAHFVLGCAYKKGLCSICGKQILDTTGYVMSSK